MTQSLAAVVTGYKERLELRSIDHPDLEFRRDDWPRRGGNAVRHGPPHLGGRRKGARGLAVYPRPRDRPHHRGDERTSGGRPRHAAPPWRPRHLRLPVLRHVLLLLGREPADAVRAEPALRTRTVRPVPEPPRWVCSVPLRAPGERRRPHPRRGQRAAGSLRRLRPAHGHARLRTARGHREPRDRRGPGMRAGGPLRDRRGASAGRRKGHHHRRAREPFGGRAGVGR